MILTLDGREDARIYRENADRRLAFHIAALSRRKRLPSVEALYVKRDTGLPDQTPEDMVAVLKAFQEGGAAMEIKFVPYGEGEGDS